MQEAESLCTNIDVRFLGRIFAIYAQYERDKGRLAGALKLSRESYKLYQTLDDKLLVAHSARHIADILCGLGIHSEAQEYYQKALDIYRASACTDMQGLANTLCPYGIMLLHLGDVDKAKEFLQEAKLIYESIGSKAGIEELQRLLKSIK